MRVKFTFTIACALALAALFASTAHAATQAQVFNPFCVSRVDITAPQSSLDALTVAPKGDYQPAKMVVNVCGEILPERPITFRLKGSGSFEPLSGKASFKIKMASADRIDKLKSFTLNSMVQDGSSIHEVLAYDAFRAVDVAAPRTGYAIVNINGIDYGLHLNLETLDDRFVKDNANYAGTTMQHLYESPDYLDKPVTADRDLLPTAVPNYEIQEGSAASTADLTSLTQLSTLDDPDFWTQFQLKFDVTKVMRFLAAEAYVGDWDGYYGDINNFYLHSTTTGVFDFLPWGKDQSFTTNLNLNLAGEPGKPYSVILQKCVASTACFAAYTAARDYVAEKIISLDLVEKAHHLEWVIATAVAADTRDSHHTVLQQCYAADATITFLKAREALWASTFRVPGSGITSAQSTNQLQCATNGPVNPWPGHGSPPASPPGPPPPPTPPPVTPPIGQPVDPILPPTDEPVVSPAAAQTPAGVLINGGAKFAKSLKVTLALAWPDGATGAEISNDPKFTAAKSFGRVATVKWTLAKSGKSRSRGVYVRFNGPSGGVKSDKITIDDVAPVIKRIVVGKTSAPPGVASKGKSYSIDIRAKDVGSGTAWVQVKTSPKGKPEIYPHLANDGVIVSTSASEVRLRVVDNAGNASKWYTVSLK